MRLRIALPVALDVTTHPTALPAEVAVQAQRLELDQPLGRCTRGRGQAATRDVDPSAAAILSAFLFVRRDCKPVLLDSSAAGVLRAHYGGLNRFAAPDCGGPMPNWTDWPELGEGEVITYVKASEESGTVIFPGAKAGRSYEIEARGLWARDPDLATYLVDADGEDETIGGAGGTFAGFYVGRFSAKAEGGSWTEIGKRGRLVAADDGDVLGVFPDYAGLYGDNLGEVAVRVREVEG